MYVHTSFSRDPATCIYLCSRVLTERYWKIRETFQFTIPTRLYHLMCEVILKCVSYLTPDLTLNVLGRGEHVYWHQEMPAFSSIEAY